MIGLFRPLVRACARLAPGLPCWSCGPISPASTQASRVTLDPADLASCEQVVSTCTVMLNDTLDAVLAACRNARHVAIVGPTAGCLPDPLFSRGVDTIGGRRVVDAAGFRDAFGKGEKWGSFASKYVIARQDYPGVDWLLDRTG